MISNWKISAKLLGLNILVFLVLAGILAVVFVSFRQTQQTITTITQRDVTGIINNAQTGRELTSIFADLLTSIFYGNKDAGQAGLQRLAQMIQSLAGQEASLQLQQALQTFSQKLTALLEQSANLKTLALQFSKQEEEFMFNLEMLNDLMKEKIAASNDQDPNQRRYLEQLQATILGLRGAFNQIISQATELQRSKAFAESVEAGATPPRARVLESLDYLLLRFQALTTTTDQEILDAGKQLAENVAQYQALVLQYQEAARAFQTLFQEVTHSKDLVITALHDQEVRIVHTVQQMEGALESENKRFSRLITVLAGILFLVIIFSSYLVQKMVKPLIHLAQVARGIAKGEVNFHLNPVRTHDEIGVLTTEFQNMMGYLQQVAQVAEAIAHGDLTRAIRPQSNQDVLNHSLVTMREKIGAVLAETQGLIQAAQEGRLAKRGQAEAFEGSWRELVVGLNNLIDAFVSPIDTTAAYIERVAEGDLPARIIAEYHGDFENIRQNLNLLIDATQEVTRVAAEIANGNLTLEVRERSRQDVLMQALNQMITRLTAVVLNVKTAAQDVAQRSRELNVVAEQMSEGAAQQAAATEEVSASMQEMAANIRQTADNAKLTEQIAMKSAADARAGKQAVTQIIQAMEVIAERISVVQEIAGQTNILSLNATIEAAKAQDFGKGFSVVASSVRELARQSRSAADEIRALVHSCVVLSAQAGEVLQRLTPNSEKTAELVQEISAASQEQSTGVEHVNQAIQQLDTVTQHTAATAEEVAASAESLTTQADTLQHTMAFFTVNEAPPVSQTQEDEILRLLQGIAKERLAALLTSALAEQPRAPIAPDGLSNPPAPAHGGAIHLDAPHAAGDERDAEFERY